MSIFTRHRYTLYLWTLKLNNPAVPYTLHWKIIDRGRIFNPITRVCRLCLKEKWHIMHNPDVTVTEDPQGETLSLTVAMCMTCYN